MKKITIPITECDVEMFKDLVAGRILSFAWTFDGVDVEFVQEVVQ